MSSELRSRASNRLGALLLVALLVTLLAALGGCAPEAAEPTATAAPTRMPTPSEPAAARGSEIYATHCAACHGVNGEGEPNWKVANPDGSLPAPPHDSSGHTWHHPDADLLEIIAKGGTIYVPESKMPGYEGVLSEAEMADVLAFLKTLWGPTELAEQERRTRDWEAMQEGG